MSIENLESNLLGTETETTNDNNNETKAEAVTPTVTEKMSFTRVKPSDLYLHGLDELPEGFDEKTLEAFEDPYRLAYDNEHPGYVAYRASAKEAGEIRKPITAVPVKSIDGARTLLVVNDGRQSTKIARELNFADVPVIVVQESNLEKIGLYTVGANSRVTDSVLVKAAQAQSLVDRYKLTQRRIALEFGEQQSTINSWLKINKASDYLKQLIVNGEHNVKPGIAWTTAVQLINKKMTDEQIKDAVEGATRAADEGDAADEDKGEEGKGKGKSEEKEKKVSATSLLGSFKEDILAAVHAKTFALPESMSKSTPVEMFILGLETAFAKKTDGLPEDFRKDLNGAMARHRKAMERAAKKAAKSE